MPSILTFVVVFAGFGAAIDFWIGKDGQKRVRDRLETWWLEFSYVDIRTFGRSEAVYASRIIRTVFGSFFSVRRITVSFAVAAFIFAFCASISFMFHNIMGPMALFATWYDVAWYDVIASGLGLLFFSLSISVTISGAELVAYTMTPYSLVNLSVFLTVMIYHSMSCYARFRLLLIFLILIEELLFNTTVPPSLQIPNFTTHVLIKLFHNIGVNFNPFTVFDHIMLDIKEYGYYRWNSNYGQRARYLVL